MALPLPSLDDRKWADLVTEGRALIPRYAPDWTDHNAHDPGITLMELLAWRAEMSIYRLNRVPPRLIRKFLALAGFEATGPLAAQAMLSFAALAVGSSLDVPAGVQFDAPRISGQPVSFELTRSVHLVRVVLSALLTEYADGTAHDLTGEFREGQPITLLGVPPAAGAAVYFGFDELPPLEPITLGLWFEGPGNSADERNRILAEALDLRSACKPPVPGWQCPSAVTQPDPPLFLPPRHHSAVIAWEVSTGPGAWTELRRISMSERPAPGEVADDTRSLTLDGIIEFNVPATLAKVAVAPHPKALFYLRARLRSGSEDAPVVLRSARPNTAYVAQSTPLWQSFEIKPGTAVVNPPPPVGTYTQLAFTLNSAGQIDSLTFLPAGTAGAPSFRLLAYAAPAGINPGSLTIELLVPGRGTGVPLQQVKVPGSPVLRESIRVFTLTAGTWTAWTEKRDFDSSLPSDFHYALDPSLGVITFSDGNRGRTAPVDHLIVVAASSTMAEQGNVRAAAIHRLREAPVNTALLAGISAIDLLQLREKAANPSPAYGGAAEQTLEDSIGAAVSTMHAHERLTDLTAWFGQETVDQIPLPDVLGIAAPGNAVNICDIERIALDTPGTRIARVRAIANRHPSFSCLHASGWVTVTVIPDMPVPKPMPTRGLLDAIQRHLDRRRIVCTQIAVTGPKYILVTVTASVKARSNTSWARVTDSVRKAIDAFLDARTGGPLRRGWPFGRAVYRSEILQLIDDVPGVDYVASLTLTADSGQPQCADIQLCSTWLPAPGNHQITAA
jgi:hypothetical protein